MAFEQYEHHGATVWVDSELKGQHRSHCLCFKCGKFKPGTPENCAIAQRVYETCVLCDLVTPVYECPVFVQITNAATAI